jgi:hypothetical protein
VPGHEILDRELALASSKKMVISQVAAEDAAEVKARSQSRLLGTDTSTKLKAIVLDLSKAYFWNVSMLSGKRYEVFSVSLILLAKDGLVQPDLKIDGHPFLDGSFHFPFKNSTVVWR